MTGNAQDVVKSCEVCLFIEIFLLSFHQSSKIVRLFVYLPLCAFRGEDFISEILQPLFAN